MRCGDPLPVAVELHRHCQGGQGGIGTRAVEHIPYTDIYNLEAFRLLYQDLVVLRGTTVMGDP